MDTSQQTAKLSVSKLQKTEKEIKEDQKTEIENVLTVDLHEEFSDKFTEDFKPPSILSIICDILIVMGTSLFFYVVFVFNKSLFFSSEFQIYSVLLASIVLTFICSKFFFYFIAKQFSKRNTVLKFIVKENTFILKIGISSVITALIFHLFSNEVYNKRGAGVICRTIFFLSEKFVYIVVLITWLMLSKNTILQAINYRIHKNLYQDRISQNEIIVEHLKKLDSYTGVSINPNKKIWAEKIFDALSKTAQKENLTRANFIVFFGEPVGSQIFDLFDVNFDEVVSKEEFVNRYVSLFEERSDLKKALHGNNDSIKQLERILMFFTVPMIFFGSYVIIFGKKVLSDNFGFLGTAVVSVNLLLIGIVSEFISCINFVYFVRPFDIGDFVEFDKKVLKVKKLGIFATEFLDDDIFISCSNNTLKDKTVSNYRNMKYTKHVFSRSLNFEKSKNKLSLMELEVREFLSNNRNKYLTFFEINNIEVKKENVEVKFEIRIISKMHEMEKLNERRMKFEIFLEELLEKLNLKN